MRQETGRKMVRTERRLGEPAHPEKRKPEEIQLMLEKSRDHKRRSVEKSYHGIRKDHPGTGRSQIVILGATHQEEIQTREDKITKTKRVGCRYLKLQEAK